MCGIGGFIAPARQGAEYDEAGGVFDPVAVHRLVNEHLAGGDHARTLWALFVFERWRDHHLAAGPLL
jgi:hypothetical protein